jgi:hypothetical protein
MPSSRAGPLTAGPTRAHTTGTRPEHAATSRAAAPHACREAIPSVTSAPLDEMTMTKGRLPALASAAAAAS